MNKNTSKINENIVYSGNGINDLVKMAIKKLKIDNMFYCNSNYIKINNNFITKYDIKLTNKKDKSSYTIEIEIDFDKLNNQNIIDLIILSIKQYFREISKLNI